MNTHKIITSFLNALLIIGAILSILTIDRGKWIPSYLSYLSSAGAWNTNNPIQNTHQDGGAGTGVIAAPQAQGACVALSQLSNPEWEDIYLLVNSYNETVIGGDRHVDTAKTQVICEK